MAENNGPVNSPSDKCNRSTSSSFFSSPRLFTCFSPKGFSDSESMMSPTSILDTKTFSGFGNTFLTEKSSRTHWENRGSEGIGLAIVDSLTHENSDTNVSKPVRRMVLFGSQLKVTIPGPKTSNSQFGSFSPCSIKKETPSDPVCLNQEMLNSTRVFTGCLSASEMELSEDYTCVISHGPNPRTTHIFDNCIIESGCEVGFSVNGKENFLGVDRMVYPSDDFLSFCCTCKKSLGEGKDIFMYRGEKAFCSSECRYQAILFDEGMEKCGFLGIEDRRER